MGQTERMGIFLNISMKTFTFLTLVVTIFGGVDGSEGESTNTFSPLPPKPAYKSNDEFDSFSKLGMEPVYKMTNTFLSMIQSRDGMPPGTKGPGKIKFYLSLQGLNISMLTDAISKGSESSTAFISKHWQEIFLQVFTKKET